MKKKVRMNGETSLVGLKSATRNGTVDGQALLISATNSGIDKIAHTPSYGPKGYEFSVHFPSAELRMGSGKQDQIMTGVILLRVRPDAISPSCLLMLGHLLGPASGDQNYTITVDGTYELLSDGKAAEVQADFVHATVLTVHRKTSRAQKGSRKVT